MEGLPFNIQTLHKKRDFHAQNSVNYREAARRLRERGDLPGSTRATQAAVAHGVNAHSYHQSITARGHQSRDPSTYRFETHGVDKAEEDFKTEARLQ